MVIVVMSRRGGADEMVGQASGSEVYRRGCVAWTATLRRKKDMDKTKEVYGKESVNMRDEGYTIE